MARKIAKKLASANYTIVSGLARGIDTEAHCGALEASNGRTIAVLHWLDKKDFYPRENFNLTNDIIENGALISEYYNPPRYASTRCRFCIEK